jgi:hypothetical protein
MNLISKATTWIKMAGIQGWRFVRARSTSLMVLLGVALVVVGFFLPWYEERTQSIIPGTCFRSCYDFVVNGWSNAIAPWQPGIAFGSSSVVASFVAFLPLLLALPSFAFGAARLRGRAILWLLSLSGAGAIIGVFLLASLVDRMRDYLFGGPGVFVCYVGYIVLLVALVLAIGDLWQGARGTMGAVAQPLAITAACCALLASVTFFLSLFAPSQSENHINVSGWSNFLFEVSHQDTFGQMLSVVLPLLFAVIFATILAGVGVLLLLVRPTGAITAWYVVPVSLTAGSWYLGEVLDTFYTYRILPLFDTHQLTLVHVELGQVAGIASHFLGLMGAIAVVLWHVRVAQTTTASGVAEITASSAPWWRAWGAQRARAVATLTGVALVILGFLLPWERESALRHSGCRWGCDGATVNGLTNAFAPFQDGTHLTGDAFAAVVTAWVPVLLILPALVGGVLQVRGRIPPNWLLSLGIASAGLGSILMSGSTGVLLAYPLNSVASEGGLVFLYIGYLVVFGSVLLALLPRAGDGHAPRSLHFFAAWCALLSSVSWATALFLPDLTGVNDWSRASTLIFSYGSPWQQFSRAVPFAVDVLAMVVPLLVGVMLLWRPPARWNTALLLTSALLLHHVVSLSFVGIHHIYTIVLINADMLGWEFLHDLVHIVAELLMLTAVVALVLWQGIRAQQQPSQTATLRPHGISPIAEEASK